MKDALGHGSDPQGGAAHQEGVNASVPANFAQFKAVASTLDANLKTASDNLKALPGVGSGGMGLTPDAVRATPEYQARKLAVDRAFQAVRSFNGAHVGRFKKEIKADIAARRASRQSRK